MLTNIYIDVKTEFLYVLINQLIYIKILKDTKINITQDIVCKLHKALYKLKYLLRLWYEYLAIFLLEKLGIKRINADHSIFISLFGLNDLIVSIFVDDIKIVALKGSGFIENIKVQLAVTFSMSDIGPIGFYLGFKIERKNLET